MPIDIHRITPSHPSCICDQAINPRCTEDEECTPLQRLDSILWMLTAAGYVLSALASFTTQFVAQFVPDKEYIVFFMRHLIICQLPFNAFLFVTIWLLTPSMVARSWLVAGTEIAIVSNVMWPILLVVVGLGLYSFPLIQTLGGPEKSLAKWMQAIPLSTLPKSPCTRRPLALDGTKSQPFASHRS